MKRINDTLGHQEGDRALIEVAGILKNAFRESDIVARLGGDEFAVLALHTAADAAATLASPLQDALDARDARGERGYKLSLSVGVASYDPQHPCSVHELLARADSLMYEHKRGKSE
jgi:diguanylate cyclase (GGDEF)-like protein